MLSKCYLGVRNVNWLLAGLGKEVAGAEHPMLGRRARAEGCARVCRARVAVRREVRAVAGKRGLPRGRAPGFMCNEAAEF